MMNAQADLARARLGSADIRERPIWPRRVASFFVRANTLSKTANMRSSWVKPYKVLLTGPHWDAVNLAESWRMRLELRLRARRRADRGPPSGGTA